MSLVLHGGLRCSLAATSGATGVPDRDAVFETHSVSGRKELVIRLTPPVPRSWIGAALPQSSPTYIPPPTLRPTSPYAAYFCLPHMIQVLTKAGINPRRRRHNAPEYILKLHPFSSLTPPTLVTLFRTSRLRGKCEALLVVDLSASVSSGTTWEVECTAPMMCHYHLPTHTPPTPIRRAKCLKHGTMTLSPGLLAPPRPPPPIGPDLTLTHPPMMSLTLKLITVFVPTLKPPSLLKSP